MAKSKRTIEVTKKRNIFGAISYALWIGTALILTFCAFATVGGEKAIETAHNTTTILSESAKAALLSIGTTAIIGIAASILIKDKLRTAFWMASVVMSAILYGSTGMYIILALWLIEEYVIHTLYKYYASKVSINKEIDLRDER